VEQKVGRTLADLPDDVTPGARQVAMVTMFRAAQADLLQPIMEALRQLSELPAETWTSGGFLVADHINFSWRTAPFKHYVSFDEFYEQELAEIWGRWSDLQATYEQLHRGEIGTAEAEARIRRSRSERAQAVEAKDLANRRPVGRPKGETVYDENSGVHGFKPIVRQCFLRRPFAR
jgi:hypothetical protein